MQHHVPLTGFDVTVESLLCKDLQLFWLPSTPKGIRTPVHGLRNTNHHPCCSLPLDSITCISLEVYDICALSILPKSSNPYPFLPLPVGYG